MSLWFDDGKKSNLSEPRLDEHVERIAAAMLFLDG